MARAWPPRASTASSRSGTISTGGDALTFNRHIPPVERGLQPRRAAYRQREFRQHSQDLGSRYRERAFYPVRTHQGRVEHRLQLGRDAPGDRQWGLDGQAVELGSGQDILKWQAHPAKVTAIEFSPNEILIVSASDDRTATIWDRTPVGACLRCAAIPISSPTSCLAPTVPGVATASFDGTAKIWDAASGNELRWFLGHRDIVWGIAFSPDGTQMVTG